MHLANRWRDDDGSAALEFITVGLILLVPLVYLVLALGALQEQSLGVEAAARHTARAIVQASGREDAERIAESVLAGIVDEYGLDEDSVELTLTCAPVASPCPAAGSVLTLTVRARVPLPLMPDALDLDTSTAIPVEATAVQKVSRLWGDGG